MADATAIREHMAIIGADGAHLGTVDAVEGDRIRMTLADSGSHSDHHHYISIALVAEVEGEMVACPPAAPTGPYSRKRQTANRSPTCAFSNCLSVGRGADPAERVGLPVAAQLAASMSGGRAPAS